ncbi:MAG: DUF2784 family protein [Burkholderiaceae bacterium]
MLYFALNLLCHVVHVALILFVLLGWLFAPLQAAHLALVLGMLGCWFILGRWLGAGYCPITDAHWRIKAALGPGRPPSSYIHYLLARLGWAVNPAKLDRNVGLAAIGIALLSVAVNVPRLLGWLR